MAFFIFMQTKEYKDYLKSKEWKNIKLDIIQLRGNRCERCHEQRQINILQLHHKTYERLFNERLTDLELLCPNCHMEEHGIKEKKVVKKKEIATPKVVSNYEKQLATIMKKHKNGKFRTDLEFAIKLNQLKTRCKKKGIEIKHPKSKTKVQIVEDRIKQGYYKTEHSKLNAMKIAFINDSKFI